MNDEANAPDGDAAFIPQSEPWYSWHESEAIERYIREGGWCTEGPVTTKFEAAFAEYTGAKHAVACPNGTLSLTLAALALGIGPGDEVIVPAYTMIATANAFRLIGATPVFVDVEPETLCLNTQLAAEAITSRTAAVVLVSANGRVPIGRGSLVRWCDYKCLDLIEDAAQSLGSRYPDGRHCGTSGIVGSFSFSAPKVISTGQGGCLITDDDDLAAKLRRIKDFGRDGGGNDHHPAFGVNLKWNDLAATVGLEQMKKLPWRVDRKKEIYRQYAAGLDDVEAVSLFPQHMGHSTPWFIDILADRRDELASFLRSRGIGTRPMYTPIPHQACYNLGGSYPVAEDVGRRGLWLPSSSQLTDEDIVRVCGEIRRFYEQAG